ncbi:MAG: prepilin-type N-terminal cleavage/methylation domain-containing protein [Lentisphaeria bacterium]|nr:prepilin-type N-terminal cleavage/methylation domain-containing protein [Lentisphaeria bacterium]
MKRRDFTLLEVIVALFLLSIGIGFLTGQFALASYRIRDGQDHWERTHELINAAEYTLYAGPSVKLDPQFFQEKFRIKRHYSEPEFPEGIVNPAVGLQLQVLTLSLYPQNSDQEIDTLSFECWKEAKANVVEE